MATRPSSPLPPPELAARIGGSYEEYRAIGDAHRRYIETLLPDGWSFEGKAILDFGCGLGRTLAAFEPESNEAEFWGCDIHEPSIEWATKAMSPPYRFFVCQESPPLPVEGSQFDLVYAMSVFTHITTEWSAWIAELHRVMRPGGIALISVLGPSMAKPITGRDWDDRVGMAIVDLQKSWDIGGPSVLLAEWWLREHWGRAFEILEIVPADREGGHDIVVMRRAERPVTVQGLEEVRGEEVRERESLKANVEMLAEQLSKVPSPNLSAETAESAEIAALRGECAQLRDQLAVYEQSRSWRLTAPLRHAAQRLRS